MRAMWVNPKLRQAESDTAAASPPAERGRRLATFPRGDRAELRVTLDEYEGRPFVSLRVWEADRPGAPLWPAKGKGCSLRLSEIGGFLEALAGLDLDGLAGGHQRRAENVPQRAPDRRDGQRGGQAPRERQRPPEAERSAGPPFEPTRRWDGPVSPRDRRMDPANLPPRPVAGGGTFDETEGAL
jgi:hypothetical protein